MITSLTLINCAHTICMSQLQAQGNARLISAEAEGLACVGYSQQNNLFHQSKFHTGNANLFPLFLSFHTGNAKPVPLVFKLYDL